MNVEETGLSGLLLIEPRCFGDERGFILESFHAQRYYDLGIVDTFVQDNHSRSKRGVVRGIHFQVRHPQAQIVTVIRGRVFDVAVDLRPDSATFGRWYGIELSDDGPRQLYMAPGFGHGFCVLSDFADLHYKVSRHLRSHGRGRRGLERSGYWYSLANRNARNVAAGCVVPAARRSRSGPLTACGASMRPPLPHSLS